jgi:hypothetical protein
MPSSGCGRRHEPRRAASIDAGCGSTPSRRGST